MIARVKCYCVIEPIISNMRKFILLLTISFLILSCANKESQVEQAMRDYDRFIFKMAADSLADCFTPTGQLGGIGSPLITGKDSIRRFLKSFDASAIHMISNQSKIKSILFRGDTAILEGRFEQKAEVNKKASVYTGDFTSKWLQDEQGRWLLQWMFTMPDKR